METLFFKLFGRFLSPSEQAAWRVIFTERRISAYHRQGIQYIQQHSLYKPAKINLGSGEHKKEGFLNVDLFPGGDVTLDLRKDLPFESGFCDFIFSEHCIEHFEYPTSAYKLIKECLRVLKPGGIFYFSVPETEWPLKDYISKGKEGYIEQCNIHKWHPDYCTTPMEHINFHFRQAEEHKFAYDFETAHKMLTDIGFIDVKLREFDPLLDATHRKIGSLFVSANKPS
ncbi:methyltransferase domain-containing protein [Armatimonas sp.]|uniref:class I SAM-dependent methyltransferase n=1 Tax=Armatimonas sp. TaxID=1872638 RepID=UPI00286D1453|nr:methyltransferase domain-containing protein [Armatimonas sp.]